MKSTAFIAAVLVLTAQAATAADKTSAQRTEPVADKGDQNTVDLFLAFKAAYGRPAPIDFLANEPDAGGPVHLKLSPAGLVRVTPQITMLISKAEGAFDCGRFCRGTLVFHYLRATHNGYEVLGLWKDIGGLGQFGAVPTWIVRHDLFNDPALEIIYGAGGGGCGIAQTNLLELTPLGPNVVASQIVTSDHSDSAQWEAKIIPVRRGSAFDVDYTGSRNDHVRFKRSGAQFFPTNQLALKPSC